MGRLAGLSRRSVLLLAALGACLGCGRTDRRESIRTHAIQCMRMRSPFPSLLLRTPSRRYPVLHSFGTDAAVPGDRTGGHRSPMRPTRQRRRGTTSDPRGCGARSQLHARTDAESTRVTTSSGMSFSTGRYESYFIEEVMPFVDGMYQTGSFERSGRSIGGYSLGGYAALRIGLTHPELFSRVGAHSPTLFIDSLPDASVSAFLYPHEALRDQRDPLRLVATAERPSTARHYIDTAFQDVNREACVLMAERLRSRGVICELHINPGSHGRYYWMEHMAEYLRFYAGAPPEETRAGTAALGLSHELGRPSSSLPH